MTINHTSYIQMMRTKITLARNWCWYEKKERAKYVQVSSPISSKATTHPKRTRVFVPKRKIWWWRIISGYEHIVIEPVFSTLHDCGNLGTPLVKLISPFGFLRSATMRHRALIFCMWLHLGESYTFPSYCMSLAGIAVSFLIHSASSSKTFVFDLSCVLGHFPPICAGQGWSGLGLANAL